MKFENNKLFSIIEIATNFVQLNILWLVFCLPVLTIFPATTAMFCVLRQWILHKDTSVYRSFMGYFKENFRQSFLLGCIGILFAGIFYLDFVFLPSFAEAGKIVLPILILLGTLMVFTLIFLFPTIANYKMSLKGLLKSSLFLSLIYFPSTLFAIFILAVMIGAIITWPVTVIFIFSLGSYAIYLICHRAFNKTERIRAAQ